MTDRCGAVARWIGWLWAALCVAHGAPGAEPLARFVVQPGAAGVAYDASLAAPAVAAWCETLGEHRSFEDLLAAWRRASALSLEAGLPVEASVTAVDPVGVQPAERQGWSVHGFVRLAPPAEQAAAVERLVAAVHRDGAPLTDDRGDFMRSAASGRLWWVEPGAVIVQREGPHRSAAAAPAPGTRADSVLMIRLDLNAIRRTHDTYLADERPLARTLNLLAVANTRWLSVDVAPAGPAEGDGPRLLVARLGWSARSLPPGTTASAEIGERRWPADLKVVPPGRWAMVLRADPMGPGPRESGGGWVAWSRLISSIGAATIGPPAEQLRQQWFIRRGDAARSAGASMGRWCVLTGGLPGAGVGELVAVAPLRGSKDATDVAWRSVLTDFVPTYVTQSGSTWVLAASVPGACDGLAWRTASLGGTPIALAVLVAAPARPADEACNAIAERLAR